MSTRPRRTYTPEQFLAYARVKYAFESYLFYNILKVILYGFMLLLVWVPFGFIAYLLVCSCIDFITHLVGLYHVFKLRKVYTLYGIDPRDPPRCHVELYSWWFDRYRRVIELKIRNYGNVPVRIEGVQVYGFPDDVIIYINNLVAPPRRTVVAEVPVPEDLEDVDDVRLGLPQEFWEYCTCEE